MAMYADSQKRHQPTQRYAWAAWPWTLEPVTDPTTDRSGNADEDDPAERGCSRLKKTVGLTSATPGGSRMTASLGGRYDQSPVKRSSERVSLSYTTFCTKLQLRSKKQRTIRSGKNSEKKSWKRIRIFIIHAEHVVHRRGYCFDFGCMFVCLYVCMYVSALERKPLIGMT